MRRSVGGSWAGGVRAALVACALAWLGGCAAKPSVSSVGPTKPQPAAPGSIAGPFVQAGTIFSAKIDEPLDSYTTPPGTPFTATVVDPLRASDGSVLVPYGAKIHGVFVSYGTPSQPRIRVELRSIDTARGAAPLNATLRGAQHLDWAAGPLTPTARAPYGLLEGDWTGMPPTPSSESGPPTLGYSLEGRSGIHVPRGALLEVMLVQPLVAPR